MLGMHFRLSVFSFMYPCCICVGAHKTNEANQRAIGSSIPFFTLPPQTSVILLSFFPSPLVLSHCFIIFSLISASAEIRTLTPCACKFEFLCPRSCTRERWKRKFITGTCSKEQQYQQTNHIMAPTVFVAPPLSILLSVGCRVFLYARKTPPYGKAATGGGDNSVDVGVDMTMGECVYGDAVGVRTDCLHFLSYLFFVGYFFFNRKLKTDAHASCNRDES